MLTCTILIVKTTFIIEETDPIVAACLPARPCLRTERNKISVLLAGHQLYTPQTVYRRTA